MLDRVFNIAGSLVVVAGVTTVLMRGSAAAQVIAAIGNTFSGSIRAAQGR